jgi:2-polyprenyl-3-methyl-5-hydroxy-6-metoxy-1,4-benzoquinol methylase
MTVPEDTNNFSKTRVATEVSFSIIVVCNNERLFNGILQPSIKNQTATFELIKIDNTEGQFKSAAEALNYGAKQANGKYIMFVHQDVELDSDLWLEKVENLLEIIPDLGIAGVAGMSETGKTDKERGRGYISDCGQIWKYANPVEKPTKVQTLDECLLIVPRSVFNKLQFDGAVFDNWHCYGADYCLSVREIGLNSYVIPAFIYHRSLRRNVQNVVRYQKRLFNKHRRNYKHIYTIFGDISRLNLARASFYNMLLPFYHRMFPDFTKYLKRELGKNDTVLDLGCGYNSPLQYCDVAYSTGVELFAPYLEESRKKAIHNEYIKADIREVAFQPNSFDVVIAIELLEHLAKEEGYALIQKMETWARKKVIITTPNGYLWQNGYDDNPLQEHKSGLSVQELRKLGFKIYGMNGWRRLKGYRGTIKYRPQLLWLIISDISQWLVFYYPKMAFQLFAVKKTNNLQ